MKRYEHRLAGPRDEKGSQYAKYAELERKFRAATDSISPSGGLK